MPRPPSRLALLTAAASAGGLRDPIGACRIGDLSLSRSAHSEATWTFFRDRPTIHWGTGVTTS
jgi:hypothetical protein